MKKILMIVVCLMAMVMNANAQRYYRSHYHSRYPSHPTYSHYRPIYGSKHNGDMEGSFWEKQQMFSMGVSFGKIYRGDKTYSNYGVDMVIGGALMSITLSNPSIKENGETQHKLNVGWQFGYFIPIVGFGKENSLRNSKWNTALLVSPIIEFNQVLNIEGQHLHEDGYKYGHHCQIWVDTSYQTTGETGYGLAVMFRHGCGTLMLKATTISIGASIGFGL